MNDNTMSTKVMVFARLSYSSIWNPRGFDGQEEKYSASLILPKDYDTLKEWINNDVYAEKFKKQNDSIKKAIENAKKLNADKFGGKIPAPSNLKTPLRDGDTDREDDGNYNNCYFINASSKKKPQIVDIYKKPITNEDDVYSGCYILATINFYAYNVSGNKGIAAGLNNILKWADGEYLGGNVNAESDFADIEVDGALDFIN